MPTRRHPIYNALWTVAALGATAIASYASCGGRFPDEIADQSYPNGHALSINAPDPDGEAWELRLVELANEARGTEGLTPLARMTSLDAVARGHSLHMHQHGFYDHGNPEGDGPAERLRKFASGWVYVEEDIWIVEATKSPEYVFAGFMASPEHRSAIMNPAADSVGAGVVRRFPLNGPVAWMYVTMEFLQK